MAKKKKKYIVKHKIKEKEKLKNKELSMEEKFYWSRAITGLLSGIFGAWPIQIVGWWMFLYMMCFQFIFPFFLSFVVFRLPYKKGKWDWKNILKTGIGVNFFIFLFASTAVHTIIVLPEWEDRINNHADTNEMIISDEIAYIADGANGLLILNISNDRTLLGKFETEGIAENIVVTNDTVYLTADNFLHLINSSDLSHPEEKNNFNTSSKINDIAIKDEIVYLIDDEKGLTILDTADDNPIVIGEFKRENSTFQSVIIEDEVAFVSSRNHGFFILNVSQPNDVQILGQCDLIGSLNSIFINGTIAFISAEDQGFHLVNITNLYDPGLLNTYNTTGNSTNVLIDGNIVYVSDDIDGIIRYELDSYSDTTPDITTHKLIGVVKKMVIENNNLYISEGTKGIEIIDLSDFGTEEEEETTSNSSISFGWGWAIFSFLSIGLIIIRIKKKVKRVNF